MESPCTWRNNLFKCHTLTSMNHSASGSPESSDGLPNSWVARLPPPPLSSNDISEKAATYSAWNEIPMGLSVRGESFHDEGHMTYWLDLTPSESLSPSSLMSQEFVVKNLALRHGNTHLPLKPKSFSYGSRTETARTYSGSSKFLALLLAAGLVSSALVFGHSTWKASALPGQGTSATLNQSLERQ